MRLFARGVVLVCLGLVASTVIARGERVRFSGPPVIGDRSISWEWEPLSGLDPYYQGNTVLEFVRTIHAPVSGEVRLMKPNFDATVIYGVGTGDNKIIGWDPATGAVVRTLLAPPSRVLDFDVHRSDQLALAALESGQIAVWDLREGNSPQLFNAVSNGGPCRYARYLVASRDLAEQRFVTVGTELVAKIWDNPGTLRREISTSGNPVTALATTTNGAYLALGDPNGLIRIYQPLSQSGSILQRLEGHAGPVERIVFSLDIQRMFSVDATGKLIARNVSNWSPAFEIQFDRQEAPVIGVRDPDGALLYAFDSQGFFQVFDGRDGRLYRSASLLNQESPTAITYAGLGRELHFGRSDGTVTSYRTGFCQPSLSQASCFGGYLLWRSPTPRADDAVLLRVYGFGDSTWSFVGATRAFADPDSMIPRASHSDEPLAGPHNGIPYYYSIVPFERRYLNGSVFDVYLSTIDEGFYRADSLGPPTAVVSHASARTETPYLSEVIVVPNPYEAGKVPWEAGSGAHVEFRHLPDRATIRLYTVAGDLIRVIEHGSGAFGESSDTQPWNFLNDRGLKVTSGVYIYHITTPQNAEEVKGTFLVIL